MEIHIQKFSLTQTCFCLTWEFLSFLYHFCSSSDSPPSLLFEDGIDQPGEVDMAEAKMKGEIGAKKREGETLQNAAKIDTEMKVIATWRHI
ncbi:hypothetical protein K1719_023471 [Acacia pycnantha]|nr:hypothetical protein K1719_023471 [Acacia pycnantha]